MFRLWPHTISEITIFHWKRDTPITILHICTNTYLHPNTVLGPPCATWTLHNIYTSRIYEGGCTVLTCNVWLIHGSDIVKWLFSGGVRCLRNIQKSCDCWLYLLFQFICHPLVFGEISGWFPTYFLIYEGYTVCMHINESVCNYKNLYIFVYWTSGVPNKV